MKPDLTIEEFCDKHNACIDGKDWAIKNCKSMQNAWETAKPVWVIWIATRTGVLTQKEKCLFMVDSLKAVEHLMEDDRSKAVIKGIEQFLNGEITFEEMLEIRYAAWDASNSVDAVSAADAAAYAAVSIAESYVVDSAAAADAAYANAAYANAVAVVYTVDSAVYTAADAAKAAAVVRQRQADWLKNNTNPNFK